MSYDIYQKRLNRYGTTLQSRVQNLREKSFDLYLANSVYRVQYAWSGIVHYGVLEPKSQNESRALANFLTEVDVNIPNGTVLMLANKDNVLTPWMVFWLEEIKASGYNKYTVLKMSHNLTWEADRRRCQAILTTEKQFLTEQNYLLTIQYETEKQSWAYMCGPQSDKMSDSRSGSGTVYLEDDNKYRLVMPLNNYLQKDDAFCIGEGNDMETYRVIGRDTQSNQGCMYISLNPVYNLDKSPIPTPAAGEEEEDFFWFNGGQNS